ncbi:solute carrier family 45, member 1/2/4 [Kwoniella mangroviensis CBS 10435]|uniref:Solute carrier family 45, member 1/2/4 n=1 Tax=Kwoniella mangroviensis CBS 10435 TaxID=1331196 RepID=A0A1B9IQD0_9TREE|nr:solute carrier family 45, member 1/2/4 [Kwoniella mangroviensis CBS 10435]
MTGGAFFAPSGADEEYDLDEQGNERHSVQWIGTAQVKGPKWAKLPLLTVGMLGIQCVWSIEMGYASPYLLELGLSKSFMSLVFMAGPLSGLIVQPLIGIFADRSRSPLGRRRPFMLAGCAICVFAMMMLGWTREISGLVNGGKWLAIALAVWSIYLIDFSINAVMSTDRALVVDTLPPREQEEGSAWAGRMFGFGSVFGFFVGNLDLPPVLPFLGKTQLQILSFMTSAILVISHTFTSWAVSERVLLRDDRPQSQSSLKANLKSIWDNMFSLPPGIRTICFVQFFASLGWFPILFFTTVWVSEIYKASVPIPEGMDEATFAADAVRSGARALLLQALVNIVTSIGFPFLVSESGVQPESAYTYSSDGSTWQIPFKGLTLIKVWWISQFVFAGAMAASWFVTTVSGAYFVIATTGFCWALSQWAPYSLLGELILIDGTIDRSSPLSIMQSRPSVDIRHSISSNRYSYDPPRDQASSSHPLPNEASFVIHESDDEDSPPESKEKATAVDENDEKGNKRLSGGLSPLIIQGETVGEPEPGLGSTVILRHSDEYSRSDISDDDDEEGADDDQRRISTQSGRRAITPSPTSPRTSSSATRTQEKGQSTADKAGVILGIHNVFLVLPQFVVTFLSSIIFYLMEPEKGLPAHHPHTTIPLTGNVTDSSAVTEGLEGVVAGLGEEVVKRLIVGRAEGMVEGGSPDAVGLIFRIGGMSAAIGGWICWRLNRNWARGKGI